MKCILCKYTFHEPGFTCRILRLLEPHREGPPLSCPFALPSPGSAAPVCRDPRIHLCGPLIPHIQCLFRTPLRIQGCRLWPGLPSGRQAWGRCGVCPGSGPGAEHRWGQVHIHLALRTPDGEDCGSGRAEQRSPKVCGLVSLGFCNLNLCDLNLQMMGHHYLIWLVKGS